MPLRFPETPSDCEPFVAAVRAGEAEAMAAFEMEVRTIARRRLLRMGLSGAEAEALAATCVTEIFLKLDKFRAGSLEAWIRTLAERLFWDEQRTLRRSVPTVCDELIESREGRTPAPRRAAPEVRRAVGTALAQLSPSDQLIIQLRYCAEPMAYQEIGRILHMSEGAVRVRCLRLRSKLDAILRADPAMAARIERWDALAKNEYEQPEPEPKPEPR